MAVELEIRHLKLLVAVAEEGTLTGAARRLNLTQSALSHQLRDAERGLGKPLFRRASRRMELTRSGERLLAAARTVVEELDRATREIRDAAKEPEGVLRIATECYTCYHWLPPALAAFQAEFPGVDVQIVADATREPIPALLDDRIDLAIVSDPTRNARIRLSPLFRDELVVIMPRGHALAAKAFVDAEDFAGQTLVTYASPREHLTVFQKILIPAGVRPKRWIPMQITEAIVELVRAGQGISVMARWAAQPYARDGQLLLRRLTAPGIHRQWSAATRRLKAPPAHLSAFVRVLARTERRPGAPLHEAAPPRATRAARARSGRAG
ncbi:MAG: LysR family transcriptional regulator [Acidobacteriota bacterium]